MVAGYVSSKFDLTGPQERRWSISQVESDSKNRVGASSQGKESGFLEV
jgi:hypothetical protein